MKRKNISGGNTQDVVIYRSSEGNVTLRADISKDTIWATQAQIAELFGVDRTVITKHIRNIFRERELQEKAVCAKFAHTAGDGKTYNVQYYNLDAVISVGYRINSKQATQFRIWATETLHDYIIHGMAVNTERIKKLNNSKLQDLNSKISFIQETIRRKQLDQEEVDSLLSVIRDYANSWTFLQKYDDGSLELTKSKTKEKSVLEYGFVRSSIDELTRKLRQKDEAGDLFGNERDETFKGILKGIYQSFGSKEIYDGLEVKAAHLLYFIIKDHPFSDGNKRIGSFLFILFLELNKILYNRKGDRKITDNTLVALALLVAESDPKEKETMVALITNLLK
ncbi:MAG: virulence protein RhuM/Fic/DOC family protein [Minisyncoccia bacterium]